VPERNALESEKMIVPADSIIIIIIIMIIIKKKNPWCIRTKVKLRGMSPRAIPAERPPLAGEVSDKLSRIDGSTWSA
jgi:hypothetical protein